MLAGTFYIRYKQVILPQLSSHLDLWRQVAAFYQGHRRQVTPWWSRSFLPPDVPPGVAEACERGLLVAGQPGCPGGQSCGKLPGDPSGELAPESSNPPAGLYIQVSVHFFGASLTFGLGTVYLWTQVRRKSLRGRGGWRINE